MEEKSNPAPDFTEQVISFNIAGYNSARMELIERIKARDFAVRLYLSAVSLIFSAYAVLEFDAGGERLGTEIVFSVIGILGLAMSQSVCNHQIKIATIGYFVDVELVEKMKALPSAIAPIDWESCDTNKRTSRLPRRLHYFYYYLIFMFPQFFSIVASVNINYHANELNHPNYHVLFLVFYIFCVIGTAIVLYVSNSQRQKYNGMRKHD